MALTRVAPAGIGSTPGTGYVIGDSFLHATGLNATNAYYTGIVTAQTFRVIGDFQVDGTTTTLDTEVTSVDKLEIGANNNTVGVAITQSGTGDILRLYDGSTQVVTVKDGGNVGIGTNNPTTALEIRTTTTNAATHYRNNASNGGAYFGVRAADLGAASAGEAYVYSYNSGINLLADGNGDINFATGGTASRVRIKDNGNTGIGTDNPVALLNPHGTAALTNTDQVVLISDSNADDAAGRGGNLGFAGYVNGNLRTLAGIGGIKTNAGNSFNGDLAFYTRVNGQANLYERVRITSAGNVGIGTDDPAVALDVRNTQPILRLYDTDATNAYTNISNLNGNMYLGARNDSSDGTLLFGGYGGGTFTEFFRVSAAPYLESRLVVMKDYVYNPMVMLVSELMVHAQNLMLCLLVISQ